MTDPRQKTFYLETFGCQMNVHDSEKVIGTLVHQGYRQVETVEEADLVIVQHLLLRDKAEQKVFNRLTTIRSSENKARSSPCWVAGGAEEGERFSRRRRMSPWWRARLRIASAAMLVQIGETTVTADAETDLTLTDNPRQQPASLHYDH